MNSQQFESKYNKLRAIIQAYLNTNKTWIVNDFRDRSNGRGLKKKRAKAKLRATAKAKAVENVTMTENATCAEKKESFRTRLLVTSKPRQDGERD